MLWLQYLGVDEETCVTECDITECTAWEGGGGGGGGGGWGYSNSSLGEGKSGF